MQENCGYQPTANSTIDSVIKRRHFINMLSKAGSAVFLSLPVKANAEHFCGKIPSTAVGDIMDLFIKQVPGAPFKDTVDTLKSGDRSIAVTGIVTSMFATIEVIRKAIDLKANFIIAHEPTFYNHKDDVDWLKQDDVYLYKAALLKQHNIAVWRNHDYVHSLAADGVYAGVVKQLEWEQYAGGGRMLTIPAITLTKLIQHVKNKLGIKELRYIGDLNAPCHKILLMPGAAGGTRQINGISESKPDVLICGEVHEWETAEYVRDARAKGTSVSLVVLGHIASEEPGSMFMANWIKNNVPGMPVTHIPSGNSLSFA